MNEPGSPRVAVVERTVMVLCLVAALFYSGCSSKAAKLTVINQSAVELREVVATGNGVTVSLGILPAAAQRDTSIRPIGESSLRLDFDAAGKHFSSELDCYFEPSSSYHLVATIRSNLSVTVSSELGLY